ncbi:hypothetical protein ABS71_15335 [bacterium SCN 62-11]|nr:hypothetical protein [Candidatus Eremiobacteraeota bacterium]ODT62717.1 MAG: hypothetical protein ABS71_15335 [bacterium SCN 62-11]
MKRGGISLAEVLICLALISVMLALVALLCRDLGRDQGSRSRIDSQAQLDVGLLRLAQEWKAVLRVVTPAAGASSPQLVVLRPDPAAESQPPGPGDRLPLPVPTPVPASFDSQDPARQISLRYDVEAGSGLVRHLLPGGEKTLRLAGVETMNCRWLTDGRLQADFELVLEERRLQRSLTVLVPLQ